MSASDRNGMIYVDHDFATNFFNAVGNDDKYSVQHQLIDEIAKLVITNTRDIVELLRNSAINISVKENKLKIGNYLAAELKKGNKDVILGITNLLKNKYNINNKSVAGTTYEKILKADGKAAKENVLNKMDSANTIMQNITNTFQKEKVSGESGTLLAERIKLNEMIGAAGKRVPLPKWAKITLIATLSVATLTVIAIIIRKIYKENSTPLPSAQATTIPPASVPTE